MSADCLFCRIASGEIPSDKVLENEHVVAFRDIHPQAPVHVLVIPRIHVASLMDLGASQSGVLQHCVEAIQEIARSLRLDATGFRVVTNHGAEAGQSVFHLHFHVLGGRPMRWPPG